MSASAISWERAAALQRVAGFTSLWLVRAAALIAGLTARDQRCGFPVKVRRDWRDPARRRHSSPCWPHAKLLESQRMPEMRVPLVSFGAWLLDSVAPVLSRVCAVKCSGERSHSAGAGRCCSVDWSPFLRHTVKTHFSGNYLTSFAMSTGTRLSTPRLPRTDIRRSRGQACH